MGVHPGRRIVEMGEPDRTYGATRIVPLVTQDGNGRREEWHIHAMMPGTAERLRKDASITLYATNLSFMKTLHGVRVEGEPGHFESRLATFRMLGIGFAATIGTILAIPLLVLLPFLPIAILTFAASIHALLIRRRFRRDERRAARQAVFRPAPD